MTAPGEPPVTADDQSIDATAAVTVTIVAGNSFLICSPDGDIVRGGVQGYFAGDTRLTSEMRLTVAGRAPRSIRHEVDDREVRSLSTVGDPTRPRLLVSRRTVLGDSVRIELLLENLTDAPVTTTVDLFLAADFADLFDVKRGVIPRTGFISSGPLNGAFVLAYESANFRRALRVGCEDGCETLRDGLRVDATIEPHGRKPVAFVLEPESTPGTPLTSSGYGPVDAAVWARALPQFEASTSTMKRTWDRSVTDVGSLLLAERGRADRPIVAAGSPWFMALFGRDSLITSLSMLPVATSLGLGTLRALAALQGRRYAPESAEQPGRILHELRNGEVVLRPGGWGSTYYGSVDATPLFVMTLAELWRWGAPSEEVAALLPAAEAAMSWIVGDGDPDGDGFVEYGGGTVTGVAALANQAWKDSDDAVRHRDGSIASGPIAMVEVQGYCHRAMHALADLRAAFGTGDPEPLRRRADDLAAAIDDRFWMADEDCYAMALDGDKQQVRSVSTNAGHLLWTGTVADRRVSPLADRLMADDMFTGFGLRTLSGGNPGFNPLSYHCGSVWPHDSAIVAAGMMQSGAHHAGTRLAAALFDAADAFDGRPPELFGGFSTHRFATPVPYPTSCSPQAWAAASSVLLVRAMLGLHPDVPRGVVHVDPHLSAGCELSLQGVALGDARLDIRAREQAVVAGDVSGTMQLVWPSVKSNQAPTSARSGEGS